MSAINDRRAIPKTGLTTDALASVLAETIDLQEQVGRTLTLLTELGRRAESHALAPREYADLTACALSVVPTLSKMSATVAQLRERIRLASGLRRRS